MLRLKDHWDRRRGELEEGVENSLASLLITVFNAFNAEAFLLGRPNFGAISSVM